MDKVFDFDDFVQCVKNVGDVIVMKCEDFFAFENGLSQSLESKPNKPLLTLQTRILHLKKHNF